MKLLAMAVKLQEPPNLESWKEFGLHYKKLHGKFQGTILITVEK